VPEKQKERYMTYVDDYYNFVSEYPDVVERKVLDDNFVRARKIAGLKEDDSTLVAEAQSAEHKEVEGVVPKTKVKIKADRRNAKQAIKDAKKAVRIEESKNSVALGVSDDKALVKQRKAEQRKIDKEKLEKLEKLKKLKKLEKLEKLENLEKLEKLEKLELLEELDYSKFFGHYSKSRRPDDHGVFSVMMRGVGGQALFREKSDYISFLKILNKLLHRYSAVLYGFILMTNHVHFLVRTFGGAAAAGVGAAADAGVGCGHAGVGGAAAAAVDAGVGCGHAGVGAAVDAAVDAVTFVSVAAAEEDVRKMFANLVTGYTGYYSRKYRTKGRLIYYPPEFSEKWRLDWQLKEIMYFINNPVLAGLSKSPGGYLWSSYSFYKELKSPLAKYIDVDASLIKDNFHSIRDFYLAIRSKKAFEKRMSKYK
jgi:hypothetical protein